MSPTSWFIAGLLAGVLATLGGVLLRRALRQAALHGRQLQLAAGLATAAVIAVTAGVSLAIDSGRTAPAAPAGPALADSPPPPSSALPSLSRMSQVLAMPGTTAGRSAEPMDRAAAELAARLERGGGTAADWNLLAQAYDFLGRPADAQRARARAAEVGAIQRTP